jgi:hypothetical protein
MRCAQDAPLEELKSKMKSVGKEVGELVLNTSQQVSFISNLTLEGMASFQEAEQSLKQAQASLKATRLLLKAARNSLAMARSYLNSSHHAQLSSAYSLSSSYTLIDSFKQRLLNICNETIISRNCTKYEIFTPLSALSTEREKYNALLNEYKYAHYQQVNDSSSSGGYHGTNSKKQVLGYKVYTTLHNDKDKSFMIASGADKQSSKKTNNPTTELPKSSNNVKLNVEELKKRRLELLASQQGQSGSAGGGGGGGGGDGYNLEEEYGYFDEGDDEFISQSLFEGNRNGTSSYSSFIWNSLVQSKVKELKSKLQLSQDFDSWYHRTQLGFESDEDTKEEDRFMNEHGILPSLLSTSSSATDRSTLNASRLVPHVVWRVCLTQKDILSVSVNLQQDNTSDRNLQVESCSHSSESPTTAAASPNPPATLLPSSSSSSHKFYEIAYQQAVEGCEQLEANLTWVCPAAAQRIDSLLPRYPINETLSLTKRNMELWRASLTLTKDTIHSANSALKTAHHLLNQAKTGRVISFAALKSSTKNLILANETSTAIKDQVEMASHRSFAMERANFDLIKDKNREFYDKPCKPVFGACCARDQADGGMNIICG